MRATPLDRGDNLKNKRGPPAHPEAALDKPSENKASGAAAQPTQEAAMVAAAEAEQYPPLDHFLANCRQLDLDTLPAGAFPDKDSKKNQLVLAVNIQDYSERELLFIQARLEGKNKTKAAVAAGCPPAGAAVQGSRLAARLDVDIRDQMVEKGLTVDCLLDKMKQLLNAKKLVYHPGRKKMCRVGDNAIQKATLDTGLKLHGAMKEAEQAVPTTVNLFMGVDVTGQPIDRSKSRARMQEVPAEVVVDE